MTVLIANANAGIIRDIHPKVKFNPSTENTCIFNCTVKTFEKIRNGLRVLGLNPYAVMYW